MKIMHIHQPKQWAILFGCLFLVIFLFFNVVGYFFRSEYISVFAAVEKIDQYEIRSTLLMEAMQSVGACTPDSAAQVWASGLEKRNAALQYAVMTQKLKDEYARQLEKNFPNWVTGVSSPWVERYQIMHKNKVQNGLEYQIRFYSATSTGPAGNYDATLTLARESDFWRIQKLQQDKELFVYTGFQP